MKDWTQSAQFKIKKHLANDPRLSDFVKLGSPPEKDPGEAWCLLGYPDDEGVTLNGGRAGAKDGPNRIRDFLFNMTPACFSEALPRIFDLGNLNIDNLPLADRHLRGAALSEKALAKNQRWMAFGGGHDYGFAEGSAFLKFFKSQKPLVINVDAHFDVRESESLHSGTAFRRLFNDFGNFDFLAIGMQSQCNARDHFHYLKSNGAKILTFDEISVNTEQMGRRICEFVLPELLLDRPIFLSLDMDAFSSAYAPGCSQSWPIGLDTMSLLPLIDLIAQRGNLRSVGFYEVAPSLDLDDRTSRLAAQIAHRLIYQSRSAL